MPFLCQWLFWKRQITQFCPIAHGWKSICALLRNFILLISGDQKHEMPFSCLLAFGYCCVRTLNLNLLQSSRVLVGTSMRMKVNTWRWQSWKMETFWVTKGLVSHWINQHQNSSPLRLASWYISLLFKSTESTLLLLAVLRYWCIIILLSISFMKLVKIPYQLFLCVLLFCLNTPLSLHPIM